MGKRSLMSEFYARLISMLFSPDVCVFKPPVWMGWGILESLCPSFRLPYFHLTICLCV